MKRKFSNIFRDITALEDIDDAVVRRDKMERLFSELFVCIDPSVRHYALKVMNNPSVIEGVLQDCYIELWNHLLESGNFADETALVKWIAIRIRGRVANERRRMQRFLFDSDVIGATSSIDDDDLPYSSTDTPTEYLVDSSEGALIADEVQEHLDAFVQTLPEIYRQVYDLHGRSNLTYDKVADEMNISQGKAHNLYQEVIALIREALDIDLDAANQAYLLKAKERLFKMEKKEHRLEVEAQKKKKKKKGNKKKNDADKKKLKKIDLTDVSFLLFLLGV